MKTKKLLCLVLILTSFAAKAADSLEVRIKLKSVNDVLTFNQTFVPVGNQEYLWAVLIDSDNNPSTGNTVGYGSNTGFDVALSISYFKNSGTTQTGSIVSNTQKNAFTLNGSSSSIVNTIRAFIDYTDTSLVMRGSKAFAELANVTAGNRYVAYTKYYSSTGMTTDMSSISTIPNIITDPTNDVSFGFIDVKEVSMNFLTTGVTNLNANSTTFNVFPNPSSGIFKIKWNSAKTASLKVFNILGVEILQQPIDNEIDLSKSPKGIYFVQLYDGEKMYIRKVVLE